MNSGGQNRLGRPAAQTRPTWCRAIRSKASIIARPNMRATSSTRAIGSACRSATASARPQMRILTKIAVIDPERSVTFAELDARTELVAASLLELGLEAVRPGVVPAWHQHRLLHGLLRLHEGRRHPGLHFAAVPARRDAPFRGYHVGKGAVRPGGPQPALRAHRSRQRTDGSDPGVAAHDRRPWRA